MMPSSRWNPLPPIPDHEGFAGSFAGVAHGALIVAGGANFPGKRPWEGGTKVWHDTVFVLEKPGGAWRPAGKLPQALGYGVSVTTKAGVVCIGGSNAQGHHTGVFLLSWRDSQLVIASLPPLPRPCANMSGALVGNTLCVAGGIGHPDSTSALKSFWMLDIEDTEGGSQPPGAASQTTDNRVRRPQSTWRELEPWPGPGRMLATAGACDGSFFLFSGAALRAGPDGKPVREWLRDAYRYTPGRGWRRIADLPRVSVAAPSPAPVFRNSGEAPAFQAAATAGTAQQSRDAKAASTLQQTGTGSPAAISAHAGGLESGFLLVIGGDDGAQVNTPPTAHRGFPRDVLAYDPKADVWRVAGEAPFSLVTTTAVEWNGRIVIPGGEARPGVRSPEVWTFEPACSH